MDWTSSCALEPPWRVGDAPRIRKDAGVIGFRGGACFAAGRATCPGGHPHEPLQGRATVRSTGYSWPVARLLAKIARHAVGEVSDEILRDGLPLAGYKRPFVNGILLRLPW